MVKDVFPLVSVVVPCFNAESTIIETLDSILLQDYRNIEIIIVNDGSTDSSLDLINAFAARGTNVNVIAQANFGQSRARNVGMHAAKGEYIMFLDADDLLATTYVSECVEVFRQRPEVLLVYSDMELFERETGVFHLDAFNLRQFLIRNCIPSFCMCRTKQIRDLGGFDEAMECNEDWECWIRMIANYSPDVFKIPKPLYFYRKRNTLDSVTDRSVRQDKVDDSFIYVYHKHYRFYKQNKLSISDFFALVIDNGFWKARYYNVWFRRFFYKLFKKSKYEAIEANTSFFHVRRDGK
ncbi:glycosyltransferase [Sphingobacterium griseoflavum]|uniref:Glycosyl transferase n=1 Tax=Sphingobacterium griseoflavum TaxID=1474952 RepID=A0ABQ3HX64_9SPHI|nr:glycosyltransferase [Sphingobacterium griseoflavum]GHE43547.1 glycosyl transferase [Sphingobacterium griseoflavum]